MDTLTRLILALVLVLLSGSAVAFGEVGKETQTVVNCTATTAQGTLLRNSGATYESACRSLLDQAKATYTDPYYGTDKSWVNPPTCSQDMNNSSGGCSGTFRAGGAGQIALWAGGPKVTEQNCKANSSPVGTSGQFCECNMGFKPVGGVCQPYSCGAPGSYSATVSPDIKVDNPGTQCIGGCEVNPSVFKVGVDGQIWGVWPFKASGKSCGGKDESSTKPIDTGETKVGDAPIPCGANMCPGSVNGTSVCVACKGSKVEGPSTEASGVTPGKDPSGTINKEQTFTECNGIKCTTTTTYSDANGNTVGTITKEQEQRSFCEENPTLSICKEGAFGGGCAGGTGSFMCEGDAVQCALAKEVHKRNCEWANVSDAWKLKGEESINGQNQPAGHPGADATATPFAFSTMIDQTERVGSGCPSDVSISYAGRAWVIPWSQHCDKLQLIGNLMVSVCMLAAAVIVFRG